MEEVMEALNKELDLIVDRLENWKREQLVKKIEEAIIQAYKKGREDQKYADLGPTKNLY